MSFSVAVQGRTSHQLKDGHMRMHALTVPDASLACHQCCLLRLSKEKGGLSAHQDTRCDPHCFDDRPCHCGLGRRKADAHFGGGQARCGACLQLTQTEVRWQLTCRWFMVCADELYVSCKPCWRSDACSPTKAATIIGGYMASCPTSQKLDATEPKVKTPKQSARNHQTWGRLVRHMRGTG